MIWMHFTLGDREYAVTLDRLSIAEAREVKKFTGVTLHSLALAGAGQVDGDVLAAVVYLAKRRAGEEVDWSEIDQVDVFDLANTIRITTDEDEKPPAGPTANGKKPRTGAGKEPAAT